MTVGLVSLGCAKNAVDLQVMVGHLVKAGFSLAPSPDDADLVLVNTCAFIESAREEAAAEILRACELKRAGRCRAVVVGGCFPQRYGACLVEAFPDVDAFLGVDELDRVAAVAKAALASRPRPARDFPPPCRVFDPPQPALRLTGPAFAYLKIAEGCAHRCAYCAIPGIRGRYRSRRPASILREAKALLATGVRELNVVAQDPMLYGVDQPARKGGRRLGLVDLLKKLDRLPGDFWIRVLYSYPSEITDDFLSWLATSPHAAKYVDVPLQHTDPRVLKAMARGGAVAASLAAADRIRAAVPGVTLRTTVMTGFPGETPAAFARLLADVRRMKFDHLGAFAFSPEEGTPAATLKGRPAASVAVRRLREVMSAQRRIWAAKAKRMVGGTFRALVVAPGVARLESQAPDVDGVVYLRKVRGRVLPAVGAFVDVTLAAVRGYDFEGVAAPARPRFEEVLPGTYLLRVPFAGVWTGIVLVRGRTARGGANVLIDSSHLPPETCLLPALADLGLGPTDIDWLLNTHVHGDHIGGHHALATQYGLKTATLASAADALRDPVKVAIRVRTRFPRNSPPPQCFLKGVEPTRLLEEGERLAGRFYALSTPGHDDDCLTWIDARTGTAFTGDSLQANGTPTQGVGFYRSLAAYQGTLAMLRARKDIRNIVCGHDYDGIGSVVKGRAAVADALAYCAARVALYDKTLRGYLGKKRPTRAQADDEDVLVPLALRLIDDVGCGRPQSLFLALHTVSEHLKGGVR